MVNKGIPGTPFYFLRHGQTDWNREGRFMGQTDIPLNEIGIKQAQEAAHYLKTRTQGITTIIASPLLRAKQTAEVISQVLLIPIHFHAGLKEACLGMLEGKVKAYENFRSLWMKGVTPEGAEPWIIFKQRVIHALAESLHQGDTTLVVAHGGVYHALMDALGYPDQDAGNCIPYLFTPPRLLGQGWEVRSVG